MIDSHFDFIDILLTTGKKCNFRCKYCFTQYISNPYHDDINILMDNIDKVFGHIDYYVERTSKVKLTFYGGEPLVYHKFVKLIFDRYKNKSNVYFCFVTNGSLLFDHWDLFEYINKEKLYFCISYDYALQDYNRKQGTYQKVRDAIQFLISQQYHMKTITTFNNETICVIKKVFDDYIQLLIDNEIDNNLFRGVLNFDEFSFKDFNFEDENINNQLKVIKMINNRLKSPWTINCKMLNRKDSTYYGNFLKYTYNIIPTGEINYDNRSFWIDNHCNDYLVCGTIFQPPEQVLLQRNRLIDQYKNVISDQCLKCCAKGCKTTPFEFHRTDEVDKWNYPPNQDQSYFCKFNQWISQYFNV